MRPFDTLVPSTARTLEIGTKPRAFAEICQKRLWHLVFDNCPSLERFAATYDEKLFEKFLEWAATSVSADNEEFLVSMDWRMHMQLESWLNLKYVFNPDVARELFASSAMRWAYSNRDHQHVGVVLFCPNMPNILTVGWRASGPMSGATVQRATLSAPLSFKESGFGFLSSRTLSLNNIDWHWGV